MKKCVFLLSLSLVLLWGSLVSYAQEQEVSKSGDLTGVAKEFVELLAKEDFAGAVKNFDSTMKAVLPEEKIREAWKSLLAQIGPFKRQIGIRTEKLLQYDIVFVTCEFEKSVLDVKVVFNSAREISGLWFVPHTPSIPVPDKHETQISLPFKGGWLVCWGGDTRELNLHHDVPNQRFAFDFLGVNEQGKTHKGDGKANEDYYAFGREVLAPADGTITDVIRGVRDNLPVSMNPYSALGNAVFIRHREHEISVLAHLKLGSIKVKVGDKVKRGQVIGLCGNSGNSSEPHLHYHLQNTPIIQDGTGIKCYFQKVIVTKDGKKELKTKYSPIKGEVVSPE